MSDLTLGTTPARLTVWLVDAAPFAATVTGDNPFPAAPELVFDTGTVWPATLDTQATTATWLRAPAQVATLADAQPRRVTLRDPGSHHVYAHGTVYVSRVVDEGDPSTVPPTGSVTVETLDGGVSITYSGSAAMTDNGNGTTTIGGPQ